MFFLPLTIKSILRRIAPKRFLKFVSQLRAMFYLFFYQENFIIDNI